MLRSTVCALAVLLTAVTSAETPGRQAGLEPVLGLLGSWGGVGEGKWGTSSAERCYRLVLEGHFIEARSRSVYPKQERNAAGEVHRNVDLFSFDRNRETLMLRQFDNEGFANTYRADRDLVSDNKLVFVSEHLENAPPGWGARLTYEFHGPNEYHERFELDTGKGYTEYLHNRYLRIGQADDATCKF